MGILFNMRKLVNRVIDRYDCYLSFGKGASVVATHLDMGSSCFMVRKSSGFGSSLVRPVVTFRYGTKGKVGRMVGNF